MRPHPTRRAHGLTCLALLTLAIGLPTTPSLAQERAGAVLGSPFGNLIVGAHIPLSDGLVLRPDFSFGVTDRSYAGGGTNLNTTLTIGLATLHYLTPVGAHRDYLVPRLVHRRTRNDSGEDLDQYELTAAFGRQAEVGSRLTLWAEGGVAFTYGEGHYDGNFSEAIRNWNAMARLGVILRFSRRAPEG